MICDISYTSVKDAFVYINIFSEISTNLFFRTMILPAFGGRERVGVDPRKVNGDNKDSIVKAAEIMHSYSFYFKTEVN